MYVCVCARTDTCLSAHCLRKAMSPKYLLAVSLSGDILVTCTFSLYFSELHFRTGISTCTWPHIQETVTLQKEGLPSVSPEHRDLRGKSNEFPEEVTSVRTNERYCIRRKVGGAGNSMRKASEEGNAGGSWDWQLMRVPWWS